LTTVRLFFLTDGVVRSLDLEEMRFDELDVRYVVWDLDKLSRLHVGEREVIELDFLNAYGGAVSCLQMADATGEYRTFLAYLPANLLARIYGEHGQRLLERNVRAFLQAKGKVNRGLQKTLREEPHRFLAYNNGLCCTAAEVKVVVGKEGHALLEWVSDFQIVNGGQTTASIYHALKKDRIDVSQVMVQVKLTVLTDPGEVSEIVPLISRYANSQNKVKDTDLFANGPFHRALELVSRRTWAPAAGGLQRGTQWYYERASGSYLDDKARQRTPAQKKEWEKQSPPKQKFSKADVAKFEHVWRALPHLACLGAEKNFKAFAERMADGGEPVVDDAYFRHLVAKAILYRTAEQLFTGLAFEGYRANSVAYALAWLSRASRQRIDLERIWREQRIPPLLCDTIKLVSAAAHQHITQQGGNPGELSKREQCWLDFSVKELAGLPDWRSELAASAFVPAHSEQESMARSWEAVRQGFLVDRRIVGDLAARFGVKWPNGRWAHPVSDYAKLTWAELQNKSGFGAGKQTAILTILKAASEESA
jgi:AIPR protein